MKLKPGTSLLTTRGEARNARAYPWLSVCCFASMRMLFAVLAVIALGLLFLTQKKSTPVPSAAGARAEETRPVSEHDWAKHALHTTAKVKRDVVRQRAEDNP